MLPVRYLIISFSIILLCAGTGAAQQPDTTAVAQKPDSVITAEPDFSTLSPYDIKAVNTEEIPDALLNLPGYFLPDMGNMGQFSALSYRGLPHTSVMPVLNGVPLESDLFANWNWRDLPFYTLKEIRAGNSSSAKYPGFVNTVDLRTFDQVEDIPFSRVNYRRGDGGYEHTDISLNRKLSENLSFYGAGSTQYYAGLIVNRSQYRFRGSTIWTELNYAGDSWNMRLNVLLSDKNNPELTDFDRPYMDVMRSRNAKLVMLSFRNEKWGPDLETRFFFRQTTDDARADSLYGRDFFAEEKQYGGIIEGQLLENEKSEISFNLLTRFTNINSTYFQNQYMAGLSRAAVSIIHKMNSRITVIAAPQIDKPTGYNYSNLTRTASLTGRVAAEVNTGEDSRLKIELSRSANPLLMSPEYGLFERNIKSADWTKLYTNMLDLLYSFKFSDIDITLNPFYMINGRRSFKRELIYESGAGFLNSWDLSEKDLDDMNYGGISAQFRWDLGKHMDVSGHYTFLSGSRPKLYAPKNMFRMRVDLHKLEDFLLKRRIDTEISLTGTVYEGGSLMTFYPYFENFETGLAPADALATLKLRAAAIVGQMTLFYENDLYSKNGYSFINGYPLRDMYVRLGVEWNFFN